MIRKLGIASVTLSSLVFLASCNSSVNVDVYVDNKIYHLQVEEGSSLTTKEMLAQKETVYGYTPVGPFGNSYCTDLYRGEPILEDTAFFFSSISVLPQDTLFCVFPQVKKRVEIGCDYLLAYDNEVFINAFNSYYLEHFEKEFDYKITSFYWDYHSQSEEFIDRVEHTEVNQPISIWGHCYILYGEVVL